MNITYAHRSNEYGGNGGLIRESQVFKHFKYLRYITKHKWYVMTECWKRGLIWRGFVHDWSKFLPSEWFPYVENFYGGSYPIAPEIYRQKPDYTGLTKQQVKSQFDRAWLHHIHFNQHHHQHYILHEDEGGIKVLEMPIRHRKEMLADWMGAGKAQGTPDTLKWYIKNKDKMVLGLETRLWVEQALGIVD